MNVHLQILNICPSSSFTFTHLLNLRKKQENVPFSATNSVVTKLFGSIKTRYFNPLYKKSKMTSPGNLISLRYITVCKQEAISQMNCLLHAFFHLNKLGRQTCKQGNSFFAQDPWVFLEFTKELLLQVSFVRFIT